MNQLKVTKYGSQFVVDSREVAEMVGKRHKDLLESIRTYIEYLLSGNFRPVDFFIPTCYTDSTGRELPCFCLTRKGCDMVANKMTGEKGVLFTAEYVTRFEEMEDKLRPKTSAEMLLAMAQQFVEQEQKVAQLEHRVTNLDLVNIEGTPRQRLDKMIKKYAFDNGIGHQDAHREFRRRFNLAYSCNIKQRCDNYCVKNGIKKITIPDYLERVGKIEDAIRVADKMINVQLVAK